MKEWQAYSKTKNSDGASEGSDKPKILEYVSIKLIDNLLPISVFILCLIFGFTGLFCNLEGNGATWALHASELSLGVFLGLLKK